MGPTLFPPSSHRHQKKHKSSSSSKAFISNDKPTMIISSQTCQEHHSPSSKEPAAVLTNSKAMELLFGTKSPPHHGQHQKMHESTMISTIQQHHHDIQKRSSLLIDDANIATPRQPQQPQHFDTNHSMLQPISGGSQQALIASRHPPHSTITYSASSSSSNTTNMMPSPRTSNTTSGAVLLDAQVENNVLHTPVASTTSTYKYGNFRDFVPNDFYSSNLHHRHGTSTISSSSSSNNTHGHYQEDIVFSQKNIHTNNNTSSYIHSNSSPSSQRSNPFHQQEKHHQTPLSSNPPPYHFHTHASTHQGSGGSAAQLGWRVSGSMTCFGGGGVQRASPTNPSMMQSTPTASVRGMVTSSCDVGDDVNDERVRETLDSRGQDERRTLHHEDYSHAHHHRHDGSSQMESFKFYNLSNMEGHTFDGNLAHRSGSSSTHRHPPEYHYSSMNPHDYYHRNSMPRNSYIAASTLHHQGPTTTFRDDDEHVQPSVKKTKFMAPQERQEFMHHVPHDVKSDHHLLQQVHEHADTNDAAHHPPNYYEEYVSDSVKHSLDDTQSDQQQQQHIASSNEYPKSRVKPTSSATTTRRSSTTSISTTATREKSSSSNSKKKTSSSSAKITRKSSSSNSSNRSEDSSSSNTNTALDSSKSKTTHLTIEELDDSVNIPIRILAYNLGLTKDVSKSWRYRDIRRALFERMIEDHIDFVDTQEEHSLLRERLPHKLTYSNFCKRVMLLVFHYLVRDGKEPKFYRRPLVKRELIESLLREKDPHFYSIVNPSHARELHTLLNTNSDMTFKQAVAIVFKGILNMETLQSLNKVTNTNLSRRRTSSSSTATTSRTKRSYKKSSEYLSDDDHDMNDDHDPFEEDTNQRVNETTTCDVTNMTNSRLRRGASSSSQLSQTTHDTEDNDEEDDIGDKPSTRPRRQASKNLKRKLKAVVEILGDEQDEEEDE
ncbi:hypothetical protein FDP41_002621 [Naegleria fowleri]|uniref:Uncharacterized protein n=1 Tax=Naegleria fowleri TaxID=5763 RepID=A0A6A5BSF8_NAEFO|nr:uncharacterized protein FDP41_002621 [Naegleria fowleri]KAF0978106.1 hypothetical protein FDP41_002621 [Naegleria fowleri]